MKKIRLTAIRAIAAAVFVFAFMLNIHTNLEGETSLFGQMLVGQTGGSSGSGSSGGSSGTGFGSSGTGFGDDECGDTVECNGSMIVVTVCDRRTSILGEMLGLKCNEVATSTCSFTNVCS